jgi:acetolactate synthase-1/2/3 large subunit
MSAAPATMSGAEALVAALVSAEVEVVFGVAGHTNVAFLEALSASPIRYVSTRHEQVAMHAADGYFRMTHRPGVVLTTSGPGMANTVSALGDASLDNSAVIVICGESQSYYAGRDAFQEVSLHSDTGQWEIARPLTKRAWRVPSPEVLMFGVTRAFRTALSGAPGPVLMSIPLDVFSAVGQYDVPDLAAANSRHAPRPEAGQSAQALELLRNAERPVILAGGGTILSEATAAITELAELLQLPVVTTLSGEGSISKYHPLHAGFVSPFGTRPATAALRGADCVLVLGSKLAEFDMSSWSEAHGFSADRATVIHVDIDPTVIGRQYATTVGICADVRATVTELVELARAGEPVEVGTSWWDRELGDLRAAWDDDIATAKLTDKLPIQPERLMSELRDALPADAVLFCDAGLRGAIAQNFPVDGPQKLHFPSGWGTMGFAIGASLGAKIARPDLPIVAEIGDGGFTSLLTAVFTAVEEKIPVIWIVRNNALFSSIAVYQRKHFDDNLLGTSFATTETGAPMLNLAAISAAAGAAAVRIEDPADLAGAIATALAADVPTVIEVISEPAPRGRASGYWDVNRVLAEQVKQRSLPTA